MITYILYEVGECMNRDNINKLIINQDFKFLVKCTIPEHDELMDYLHCLFPFTGIIDKTFCNYFMYESVELLKHAIFLYEDGYFDCAFYSVRQSIENLNNMLYLADKKEELKVWKTKKRFPSDKKIKEFLENTNKSYDEIKNSIPETFDNYQNLLQKVNKYIHKQGYDTFYINVRPQSNDMLDRMDLFVMFLKNAIQILLLMNIILDPLSFALIDENVDRHIHFDPATEAIPKNILDNLFEFNIIDRIKQTQFYKDFIKFFLKKEILNEGTYEVIRYQYFDINKLQEIESQKQLLDIKGLLCLSILNTGALVSHIYFHDDFFGYFTNLKSKHQFDGYTSNQFDEYTIGNGQKNVKWNNTFISVYKFLDTYVIFQHDDKLDDTLLAEFQNIIDNICD